MLAIQVDFWKLKETQRHNLAQEEIDRESNRIGWSNASANLYSASANLRNAETNVVNAESNRINALANQKNAESNAISASANLRNAATNEMNAQSNRMNAESNKLQAEASWKNANSQATMAQYNTEGWGAVKDAAQAGLATQQNLESEMRTRLLSSEIRTEQEKAKLTAEQTKTESELRSPKKFSEWTKGVANVSNTVLNSTKSVGELGRGIVQWQNVFNSPLLQK